MTDDEEADAFVHHIATDWRLANLSPADQALCLYAEKLTNELDRMSETDVIALREQGFNDRAIHDTI